jgi:hypothetical protein
MAPPVAQATVDLNAGKYQSSMNAFRDLIERSKDKIVVAKVVTPVNKDLFVQVRVEDIYVIAFHGADGWYTFDDQQDGEGRPCGVGSNYAQLGYVGNIVLQDLISLGTLADFSKGVAINKRLLAVLFAVVSEATRFASAATYFTGITNGVVPGMNFEYMRSLFFNNWTKPPDEKDMVPGKVYHYVKGEILVPRSRP